MNKFAKKILSVALSAAMVVGMFAPMSAQAATITSDYMTTSNGLSVKLTAVIDGNNNAYAADWNGAYSSVAGNYADVFDGNTNTGIIYRTGNDSWDGYIQDGDYIQLDFEEAIDFDGIVMNFYKPYDPQADNQDGFRNGTLLYTTDGEKWEQLASYNGIVETVDYDAPQTIPGVTAIKLVNNLATRTRVWVRLAEIAVDGAVAAPAAVDKTALNAAIEAANALEPYAYKDFVGVMEALDEAWDVANDDDATQAEVDAALAALQAAVDALEPVETPDPEPTPDPTEEVCEIFEDVAHGDWYEAAVQYVYDNGIMSGNEGLFKPTGNITRAQVVQTLYNLEGKPEVTDYSAVGALVDVEGGQWYTDAVCWAYNTAVTTGNSDTKMFNMNTNVTRQQLATFIYRYAELKGYDVSATTDISAMVGGNDVADYAVKQVKWAVATGLIKGSETAGADGSVVYDLKPTGTATRAQVATILQRFCEANNLK